MKKTLFIGYFPRFWLRNVNVIEKRKTIIIPVKTHLIKSLNDDHTTTKNDENLVTLSGESNKI